MLASPPARRCQSARWPLIGDAGAGEVRDRERLVAAGLPGVEGEVEGGELEAAGIELEAEQVVAQDGVAGLRCGEALLLHPHPAEHVGGGDEEVARAAAGVHDRDLGDALGPALEGAGGRGAVVAEAQVLPLARSGLSGWRPAHQAPSEFSSRKRTM